jgi:WD40 repeat protein
MPNFINLKFFISCALIALQGCSLTSDSSTVKEFSFTQIGVFEKTGSAESITFSSLDDRLVLVGGSNGYIRAYRVDTLEELWKTKVRSRLSDIAFSPDGSRAVVVGNRGMIAMIDTTTGEVVQHFEGHAGWIQAAAFSPNGRYIATGSSDSTVMIWDSENGEDIHLFAEWAGSQVRSLVFSDDGKHLAAAISEELAVYELKRFTKVKSIRINELWVSKMRFSPGMEYAAVIGSTNGTDNDALVIDMETEKIIARLKGHKKEIRTLEFSADRTKLITGSSDKTVRVWDILSKREIAKIDGFDFWVLGTALSKDGKRLLVSDLSFSIKVYEVNF